MKLPFFNALNNAATSALVLLLYILIFFRKIFRRICNLLSPDQSSRLQSLYHHRNVVSLSLIYKYFHGKYIHVLMKHFVPRLYESKRTTRLANRSPCFTAEISRYNHHLYFNIFSCHHPRLWNYLCLLAFLQTTVFKYLIAIHLLEYRPLLLS